MVTYETWNPADCRLCATVSLVEWGVLQLVNTEYHNYFAINPRVNCPKVLEPEESVQHCNSRIGTLNSLKSDYGETPDSLASQTQTAAICRRGCSDSRRIALERTHICQELGVGSRLGHSFGQ